MPKSPESGPSEDESKEQEDIPESDIQQWAEKLVEEQGDLTLVWENLHPLDGEIKKLEDKEKDWKNSVLSSMYHQDFNDTIHGIHLKDFKSEQLAMRTVIEKRLGKRDWGNEQSEK
jgi:hypothetical protein